MWVTACKAFKEVQAQSSSEAERQRQCYDCKANAISLESGDMVLAKANAYKGRRKDERPVGEGTMYEAECQVAEGIPFIPHEKTADQMHSQILHQN